ncbi:MAG: hypothetical protein HY044_01385 [Candidatus Woesebacteria bacterium]|nr:MAG: hypothetical protein HY044_01385 [Candidatus Woesebacteria bacterium]
MRKTIISLGLGAASTFLIAGSVFASNSSIDGNGAGSINTIVLKSKIHTLVSQSNEANFYNKVGIKLSSGKNKANKNTNSDVTVGTGDSTALVDITNQANANSASDPSKSCCPCQQSQLDPSIIGNGADSTNKIIVENKCSTTLVQSNDASISNNVWVSSSTGGNVADKNTGGSVSLKTGSSDATVTLNNSANVNTAN